MVDAKKAAIERAADDIALAIAIAIKPHLEAVFDAGQQESMAAIQRAISQVNLFSPPMTPVSPPTPEAPATAGKDGRAPRGAVRAAVMAVLRNNPQGLTSSQISEMAPLQDPRIAGLSASNELNRNKGKFYRQNVNGLWHILREATADDLLDENPDGDEATGPGQV